MAIYKTPRCPICGQVTNEAVCPNCGISTCKAIPEPITEL